ncbi:MAG: hypothetical protein II241_03615 [Clostridia bacterium]|nr:hypothetical protein [Clostridia bacterium]
MDKEKELPKRKHPRLENYDYSSAGAYFVTICTQNRRCVLSRIVGRGLAPAITSGIEYTLFGKIAEEQLLLLEKRYPCLTVEQYSIMPNHIHAILILANEAAGASPRPTRMNEAAGASPRPTIMDIVCAHKSLTTRENEAAGASPRPTIMDIVCAYKSLTTRECKKNGFDGKLFQTSFYEHIIRGQEDYDEIAKYIYENPMQWYCDELYAEE